MSPPERTVEVDGRTLTLSNLDKVLWPSTGFTKAQMVDYYSRVAPVMLAHLAGRPVTLRRWPDGVEAGSFFEKNCPSHRPEWVPTITQGDVAYCSLDEPAALVWTANLAAIELHPTLASAPDLDRPRSVVFDLDPGPPADLLTCARVALVLRSALEGLGLSAWAKTSGSKGIQVYVPTNTDLSYDTTRDFAHRLARLLGSAHPDLVVTTQQRTARTGKVLIDWAQNHPTRTTVCVYSLRAWTTPAASTPVTWEELEGALEDDDRGRLRFSPEQTLRRIAESGDLMAPLLEVAQELPRLA